MILVPLAMMLIGAYNIGVTREHKRLLKSQLHVMGVTKSGTLERCFETLR